MPCIKYSTTYTTPLTKSVYKTLKHSYVVVAWHELTGIQQFLSSAPGTVRPTASGSARGSRSANRLNHAARLSCNNLTLQFQDYRHIGYDATLNGDLLKIFWKACCLHFMAVQEMLPGRIGSLI
jgi:hypothetical protein